MPKASHKGSRIAYPPGCKTIDEELGKDELVKRLKALARAFQDMGQDDNEKYTELALHLASEFFLSHPSKDVKLLVACCIADVFRIFAPEAPFNEQDQLKEIFMFLIKQLRGLEEPEAPSFKRYFYLLENLAWVKSFNICIELDDNQEIFCALYKLMFNIVNDKHSSKVKNFMLDMMCPLITEADSVSQKLLDIILINIVEPYKSQNRQAYYLAKDLIKRTANAIEPYIQGFFNSALMLGKTSESEVSDYIFPLIYELNQVSPSVLLAVLPQMEFKLKSNDEKERKAVTKLLAKMFSDPDSDLAVQNKPLWICFLGRFNDISIPVRTTCVQYSQHFLINHPNLVKDITECLRHRQHDQEESIRHDVVQAIISVAKKDLNGVNEDLLGFVKERTLDKRFKVRREALMGLAQVYKKYTNREQAEETDEAVLQKISWIKNKALHVYYQTNIEDRLVAERIFHTCLVPYTLEPVERMRKLYQLYGTLDQNAVRALNEMLKCQYNVRVLVRQVVELVKREQITEVDQMTLTKLTALSKQVPENNRSLEHMKKLHKILAEDKRIQGFMEKLVSPGCECKKAEELVKEILKKVGSPSTSSSASQQSFYVSVKTLLERVAPVLIDKAAVSALMAHVDDVIRGLGEVGEGLKNPSETGLKLLMTLSFVFPGAFLSEDAFEHLITFLKHEDDTVSDLTLQIFCNTGQKLQEAFPNIFSSLLPVLQSMAKMGTPKQAKHAIKCIGVLCKNKAAIFTPIVEHLKTCLNHDSANFLTALVSLGHIAQSCPQEFAVDLKGIVSKFIVKELLMQDQTSSKPCNDSWYADHLVSEETQAKVHGMKLIVRWLLGLKLNMNSLGTSTLRLLHTCILHEGDLMERGEINEPEKSRLRLAAGNCMLKLAQEKAFSDIITHEQFQALALLINDSCYEVRVRFTNKLNKGLIALRLPLEYLSVFSLAANDPMKERRLQVKQFIMANVVKRRDVLKQNPSANNKLFSILPEYVLPYTIHLLAHDPDLTTHMNVAALKNIRECMWYIMEPLTKTENTSYNFFRKMFENIKQTKDAQGPENEDMNKKLYAVCDLGLGLLVTKGGSFVYKDYPAKPVLPLKLFTQPDEHFNNTRVYLPKELLVSQPQAQKKKPPVLASSTPIRSPAESKASPASIASPPSPDNKPQKTETATRKTNLASQKTETATRKTNTSSQKTEAAPVRKTDTASQKKDGAVRKTDTGSNKRETTKENKASNVNRQRTEQPVKKATKRPISDPDNSPSQKKQKLKQKTLEESFSKGKSPINSNNISKTPPVRTVNSPRKLTPVEKGKQNKNKPLTPGKSSVTAVATKLKQKATKNQATTKNSKSSVASSSRTRSIESTAQKTGKSSPTKMETRKVTKTLNSDDSSASPRKTATPTKRGRVSSTSKSETPQKKGPTIKSPGPLANIRKAPEIKANIRRTGRQNVRKAAILNGTSDGEDTDSQTTPSPRKRTAALNKAIEALDMGAGANTRNMRKRKK